MLLASADGVSVDTPVLNPSQKELVISQMPDERSVSRLRKVKNALVIVETQSNYVKGLSLKRLKPLRPLGIRVVLDDSLQKKHVRQVRFLGDAEIAIRVSERFLKDPGIVGILHEFGPVEIEVLADLELARESTFWERVSALKRVQVVLAVGSQGPGKTKLDRATARMLSARPAGVRLALDMDAVPNEKAMKAVLEARTDRLLVRIKRPEDLRWDLIDYMNGYPQLAKTIILPPVRLTDDAVLRLAGVHGATVRVRGAEFLGYDSILKLNSIGR